MTYTTTTRDRIQSVLGPHVQALEEAAAEADDPAEVDVYTALAALGRGEDVPTGVAQRIVARAEENQ